MADDLIKSMDRTFVHRPSTGHKERPIVLDLEEVDAWIKRMQGISEDFDDGIKALDQAYDEAVKEASKFTRDGKPAPIYRDLLAAYKARVDYLKEQIKQQQDNIAFDNQQLRTYANRYRELAEDAAQAVDSVDVGGLR